MPPPPGRDPTALSFNVLAEIAAGETAKVELCRVTAGPSDGRLVAVKRLHPHLADDPSFVAQFRDEMWMTAALRQPNVVEVVGWGSDERGLYLAVELVQGVSLARLMKTIFETGEAFTERMVVFIARQLCRGLAAAHALRSPSGDLLHLVHRDLTPSNVLCSFQGDIKITDFGLAKAKQRLTHTITGMVKGQLEYIAPEQANGTPVDARADIFSLGVMLFELFAGRRPWVAANDMEFARMLMTAPPPDLAKLRPKIHGELVTIVNRCLEKDPAARFQSAAEIQARLDDWLSVHGYTEDNEEALGRFVRRNGMRQMAWFERVIAGSPVSSGGPDAMKSKPRPPTYTGTVAPPISQLPVLDDAAPPTERPGSKNSGLHKGPMLIEGGDTTTQDGGAEARVAAIHARALSASPRIAMAPATGDGPVDWGEEVPTLVKGTPEQLASLRQAFRGGKPFDPKAIPAEARAPSRPPPPVEPSPGRSALPTAVEGLPSARKDAEDQDDPTAPIGDLLRKVRAVTALKTTPTPALPGQIAPNDPAVPPPPVSPRSGGTARPPPPPVPETGGEERLRAEAERLSIEAMRLVEETKAAYARAERKAALAKATSDAAALAADALRTASSAGIGEALRKLEIALAMERTARASDAAGGPISSPSVMPKPAPGALAPPMPPAPGLPSPPAMSPAPPAIPSSPPVPSMAAALRTNPPGAFSPEGRVAFGDVPHRVAERQGLAVPAPAPAPAPADPAEVDMFTTRLQPKVFGLPRPVAMGVVGLGVLVVVLIIGLASC
ncbi:serine/threonine-protein kinase [Polyangium aurulentum]|uniref:serine/threonine-protein kinase n=1 Tax=Polyangium aurulentum TaxID=2567896 RepID=UPI0010ADA9AF|nr:serine/threonine-protein kinase [Polyangium aurulentum]UQA58136.1 serine/threonine protein kinase [Polyangium aurulentum]